MDERNRLLALLEACHGVIRQLEKIGADDGNPFAKWIRETCRPLMAQLKNSGISRGRVALL